MSVAIGLIGKKQPVGRQQVIVLACDSQTTSGGGSKSVDAMKMNVINFEDAQALIAQVAFDPDLANQAVEYAKKMASEVLVDKDDTIPQLIAKAVQKLRAELKENQEAIRGHDANLTQFFLDHQFEFIIAYFFDKKPFLYSIKLDLAVACRVQQDYRAIGTGRDLAEYLIREFKSATVEVDYEFTDIIAISTVHKVSQHVEGCGGPTWYGVTYPMPNDVLYQYGLQQEANRKFNRAAVRRYFKSEARIIPQSDMFPVNDAILCNEKLAQNQRALQLSNMLMNVYKSRESSKKN